MATILKHTQIILLASLLGMLPQLARAEEQVIYICESVRAYENFPNKVALIKKDKTLQLGNNLLFKSYKENDRRISSWVTQGDLVYNIRLNKQTGKLIFSVDASPTGKYITLQRAVIWSFICKS